MKSAAYLLLSFAVLLTTFTGRPLYGQVQGGDILNEAPLSTVPTGMTFEEYRDMNRRLTVGLMMSAIPIPGMIHFYADEQKTGWIVLGTAAVGAASILAGALSAEEGDFPESDFGLLVFNPDKENERRYEKIPYEITNNDTAYHLQEIFRQSKGAGTLLVIVGAAIIAGDIAYDFIHGVTIIEKKRDLVRFKYGQMLGGMSIEPSFNLLERSVGVRLSLDL